MISRAADYGLRAALALAGRPPGTRMTLADLAAECDVPAAFLYKVLRGLVERRVLTAHRGKCGGYELAGDPNQVSVLEVVGAVDGWPVLNTCLVEGGCHRTARCGAHPVWRRAQAAVCGVLASARLGECIETGMGDR